MAVAAAAFAPGAASAAVRDVATARDGDRGRIVLALSQAPSDVSAVLDGERLRVTLAGVTAAAGTWEPARTDLLTRFDTRPTEGGFEIVFALAAPPRAVRANATPGGAVVDLTLADIGAPAVDGLPATGLYAAFAPPVTTDDHRGGPGGHFPRALPPPEPPEAAAPTAPVVAEPPPPAPGPPPPAVPEADASTASYEVTALTEPAPAAPESETLGADAEVAAAIAEAVAEADAEFTEFAGEHGTGTDGLRARPPERADRADPARILVDRVDPEACLASGAAIAEDPWDLDHLEPHAQCLLHEGDAAGAAAVYERLLTFAPDAPDAHMGLGVAKQALGETRAARQHFEDARVLALSDSDAMRARALLDQLGE